MKTIYITFIALFLLINAICGANHNSLIVPDSIYVYDKNEVVFQESTASVDTMRLVSNNKFFQCLDSTKMLLSYPVSIVDSVTFRAPAKVEITEYENVTIGSSSNTTLGCYFNPATSRIFTLTGSGIKCDSIDLGVGYSSTAGTAGLFFISATDVASNILFASTTIATEDRITSWNTRNPTELKFLSTFTIDNYNEISSGNELKTLFDNTPTSSTPNTSTKIVQMGVGKALVFKTVNGKYGVLWVTAVNGSPAADRKIVINYKIANESISNTQLNLALNTAQWTSYPIQSGVVLKVKDFINGEITGKNMKFRILEVDPSANVTFNVVSPGVLTKPSEELASTVNGLAAINGSFFDGTTGLAQTYLRINGTKINGDGLTGGEADNKNRAGGSVVVDASGTPTIQLKPTPYVTDWQDAIQGQDVLSGGPVLLLDRKKVVFSPSSYNTETSYRRTVIAKKMDGTTVLLAIEGSNSCFDLQQLVYALGYKDAINLDGGGSTMMVIKDRGLVITPTDADGERSVSNMLILKSK
mgnify:CR=1 FL=1